MALTAFAITAAGFAVAETAWFPAAARRDTPACAEPHQPLAGAERQQCQRRPEGVVLYRRGRKALELDLTALGTSGPRVVSQPHLLKMLVAEAQRYPAFLDPRRVRPYLGGGHLLIA